MASHNRVTCALWFASAFVLLGPKVSAAPTSPLSPEEERLLKKGVKLREAGDEHHAVVELQKAYDIGHSPRAAGQLGLSEWALGRWVDAEAHVTEALKATSDPFLKDKQRRQILEKALNTIQSNLGTIEVSGDPPGAEVVVGGKIVGKFPLSVPVRSSIGNVETEVSAEGYETDRRIVNLGAGQYQRILIRLKKTVISPLLPQTALGQSNPSSPVTINLLPAQAPASEPAASPPPAPIHSTRAADPTPQSPLPTWRIVAKWTAFGASIGALGVGVGANMYHEKKIGDFGKSCLEQNGTVRAQPASAINDAECLSLYRDYMNLKAAAIAGYIGAGVLATTWLILWLSEPTPNKPVTTAWGCVPQLAAPGISCMFRYD